MDLSSTTEVASTDDIVLALLDYLVDPLLPLKSTSLRETPSLSQQESVAKQMYATVLLYNYYQRKYQPELHFLDFESFCKLAVMLKPSLMLHMNSTQQFDLAKLDDLENQLSLTEKAILNACSISMTLLDASEDMSSSLKEWPIIKVAVLVVDSKKENCLLLFDSVTNGVWSVIEKDIDSESIMVGSKRKRFKISKPTSSKEDDAGDEAGLQKVASLAVKKNTGFDVAELKVLHRNVVYNLSKEKTAARFYIMQSTQAISEDCQVPIKDAIDSLQGPLVSKSSGSWMITPAVEYFHLLPYAGIISDWFSGKELSNSSDDIAGMRTLDVNRSLSPGKTCDQKLNEANGVTSNISHNVEMRPDVVKINSLGTDKPCDSESTESRNSSDIPHSILDGVNESLVANEATGNHCNEKIMEPALCSDRQENDAIESPGQTHFNGSHPVEHNSVICLSTTGSQSMDIDKNSVISLPKENITISTSGAVKVYRHYKKKSTSTPSMKSSKSTSTTGMNIQAEVVKNFKEEPDLKTESFIGEFKSEKLDTEKHSCVVSPNLDGAQTVDCSLVPFEVKTSTEEKSEFRNEKVDTEKQSCVASPNLDGAQTVDCSLVPFEVKTSTEEKIQATFASKETTLSQTALRVLVRKREKLCNELRNLEDEMAVCERNIQAIVDGAENHLDIKLEAILDCCNDICLQNKTQAQYWMNQNADNQRVHNYPMGKRLSDAILSVQTPCQELNDICCANNWMLPVFRVTPCDGGYSANISVKGLDFECSCETDIHPTLNGARNMAAELIIAKLQNMASQVQLS